MTIYGMEWSALPLDYVACNSSTCLQVWTVLPGAGNPLACPKVFPVFKVVMGCHGVLKLCYSKPCN